MNIGIFTDTYFPQVNGVVTSTHILERELSKLGHNVYIFTCKDPRSKNVSPRVFRLPSMPFVFLPTFRMSLMYSPKAVKLIRKLNLDIVHTQTEFSLGVFGGVVSRLMKIPLVHTYHTMYEDYVHYIAKGHIVTPGMAKDFSRVYCNTTRAIIAPTEKVSCSLKSYGVKRPIYVIPTGIDIEPFKKENFDICDCQALRQLYGINSDDFVVLFIGRIAKEKSIDVVLNQFPTILESIPNAKFVLVGNGPVKKDLQMLADNLNISNSVVFTGEQPWESIGKFYQLGDVFISASVTEAQGLTFSEAMAAKLPVVAKFDRSIENLITDGVTGRFFENDEDIAPILFDIYSDKEKYSKIVDNAYDFINKLSSVEFAKRVESVYNDVLKSSDDRKKKRSKLKLRFPLKVRLKS